MERKPDLRMMASIVADFRLAGAFAPGRGSVTGQRYPDREAR